MKPYAYDLDEWDFKRERQLARELRQSQWWKRRCAKGRCNYCGAQTPAADLTMDHIVPLARGEKAPREMWFRRARPVTPRNNNSFPWSGMPISSRVKAWRSRHPPMAGGLPPVMEILLPQR